MALDETKLREVLGSIHTSEETLTSAEASAIVDVARLAAGADGATGADEQEAVGLIARIVYGIAGVTDVPAPSKTIDAQRALDIGTHLEGTGARELAFACARFVVMQDMNVTEEESELMSKLAEALLIEPTRANDLIARMDAFPR